MRFSQLLSGLLVFIVAALIVALWQNPSLPALNLTISATPNPLHPASTAAPVGAAPLAFEQVEAPGSAQHTDVTAFFVTADSGSFSSLKKNIKALDWLIPDWLYLDTVPGSVVVNDPDKQAEVLSYLAETRPSLAILPLISNYDSRTETWDDARLNELLNDPAARLSNIEQLLAYVKKYGMAGILVDFRNIAESDMPVLQSYMRELYVRFHPMGLQVAQAVPADDINFDYAAFSATTDYLVLQSYNQHNRDSAAGPIASQTWFNDVLRRRFAQVPANKIIIGLGAGGYTWPEAGGNGRELTFYDAMHLARQADTQITLDQATLNPTFEYTDEDGTYTAWFLDGITLYNQIAAARKYQPKGWALWRLGAEDAATWDVLQARDNLTPAALDSLRVIGYSAGLSDNLSYAGEGEVIKVTNTAAQGTRRIDYNVELGLVTDSEYTQAAASFEISRWGKQGRQIALTFDDGPDPTFTPQVIQILNQYHVPATFFVIGANANLHPDLLKQVVEAGYSIGNHTYTHPDIAKISDEQLRLEVNATQRLFESILGRRSVLFRPPYAVDVNPDEIDQIRPLVITGQLGYYTIGMEIDPYDWSQPGVDQIVASTLKQANRGVGNVVLLHDGGGDRSQTIQALPQIIEKLRANGFTFVSLATLINLPEDQINPRVTAAESTTVLMSNVGFSLMRWSNWLVSCLFVLGIFLGIARLTALGLMALLQTHRAQKIHYPTDFRPEVSVIVPAYNEEKVIVRTIQSLLRSDYPNFDIIVVDDGSKDNTSRCVQEVFAHEPRVKLFTIQNGGKASALNFGIAKAQSEIIIALDADTVFDPAAIKYMVRHFANPEVGAVAGNAKVGNRRNIMTRWQALEYVTSQNLDRRAFALLNCITVVPGAIGAWRRQLVLEAGGFGKDTLAEDADLTVSILRRGCLVAYEEKAIAYTEAPETVRAFLKQRFRWTFGTMQVVWKHRAALFSRKTGALGMIALPNIVIFQVLFPLISPLLDLVVLTTLVQVIGQMFFHAISWSIAPLAQAVSFYILFMLIEQLAATIAFLLEPREDKRLLLWLFLQRFVYRQFMYYVVIKSTLTAIRGSMVGWGKQERRGIDETELQRKLSQPVT